MNKTGVLLINVGTPDSTKLSDVRKFLSQFLGDKRVISIPTVPRKLLVNGIIVPFRAPKSRILYQRLWTKDGSPLLVYSLEVKKKLQNKLGENYKVYFGMRYGNPSLEDALKDLKKDKINELILLPLFPQYASATSGTAIDFSLKLIRKWNTIPKIKTVSQFYKNDEFINVFALKIKTYLNENYDHILFSYHGLPLKQVFQSHNNENCNTIDCINEINDQNKYCYHATCYHTTRLLADKLKLENDVFTTCFQSRFAKKWLSPYTDEVIIQKAKEGIKKILVVSPAFTTDCLETIVEIGIEYKNLFLKHGGEHLQLVESLNDSNDWISALISILLN